MHYCEQRAYYVYILTNKNNNVLYTGITNSLDRRMAEHRHPEFPCFTAKYNITKLVYFEEHDRIDDAIYREKQIKGWTRWKKIQLIQSENPYWKELWPDDNGP
jgi:putative endonuclease